MWSSQSGSLFELKNRPIDFSNFSLSRPHNHYTTQFFYQTAMTSVHIHRGIMRAVDSYSPVFFSVISSLIIVFWWNYHVRKIGDLATVHIAIALRKANIPLTVNLKNCELKCTTDFFEFKWPFLYLPICHFWLLFCTFLPWVSTVDCQTCVNWCTNSFSRSWF